MNYSAYATAMYALIIFLALVLLARRDTRWDGSELIIMALMALSVWLLKVKKCLRR